jgi:2-oxoglutarate ferredoxin oxidoreductase subunit gamma
MDSSLPRDRLEIRLAGEGGQGMILAGIILAEAAAVYDGKNAVQTQSYGPEARGGASKAEVIISNGEIDFPEIIAADVLVAMSQEACDKYTPGLKQDGLLIVDSEKVGRVTFPNNVRLPITDNARQASGRTITANIYVLGLVAKLTGAVSFSALEKAVAARAPKGTQDLNLAALQAGYSFEPPG